MQLAIDFARLAWENKYGVGILVSADTDLKPALEAVVDTSHVRVEVAAGSALAGPSKRLSISQAQLWCHWLDVSDFQTVADTTDYNVGS